MSLATRRAALAATLAAPAVLGAQSARAQAQRPLRIVVPFVPGGAIDLIGRLYAERLPRFLDGQNVVVDNRAGAGGMLGAENVARSAPDGTTLSVIGVSALCAFPFLYDRIPYDPLRDFTPVTQVTSGTQLLVLNAAFAQRHGITDLRTLLEWGRRNPEQIRAGSSGVGTTSHLLIAALTNMARTPIVHVPYRGGAPALQDLLTGTIELMFDVPTILIPQVAAGALRAIAVSTAREFPLIPGVPGMGGYADQGIGELDVPTWNQLVAPANTPPAVARRQFEAIRNVATQPDFVERMRTMGFGATLSESPAAAMELIRRDTPRWRQLVELSGARLEFSAS
jgi:tripartite-type tricarboxylate transporter receptor subunit TctC